MAKFYFEDFKYCPVCGRKYEVEDFVKEDVLYKCPKCKFRFYQNIITVCAALIPKTEEPNKILLTTRNINPHKGMIDTPGGFIKYYETPEQGIIREVKEELGIDSKIDKLFDSNINDYEYEGRMYKHASLMFLMQPVNEKPRVNDKKENSEVDFYDVFNLDFEAKIAFPSDLKVLKIYAEWLKRTQA